MPAKVLSELFVDLPPAGGVDTSILGPEIGGKARSLFRLASAGLPTPPGFVIRDQLFRGLVSARAELPRLPAALDDSTLAALATAAGTLEQTPLPDGFLHLLRARLAALGGPFAVRSSFALEDEPGRIAAGIYESRVDVAASDVPDAIRAVLASALCPAAAAYAITQGLPVADPPVAVLVHRFVPGVVMGHAALDPTAPQSEAVIDSAGPLPPGVRAALEVALARLTERFGGIEVEWVVTSEGKLTFLQMRPYAPPSAKTGSHGWDEPLRTTSSTSSAWIWDADHNPLPLSPAHAGLVAYLDERCRIGLRQRVWNGYLFWRRPDDAPEDDSDNHQEDLTKLFDELAHGLGPSPAAGQKATGEPLEATLARFATFYQVLFGRLQPATKRARRALGRFLEAYAPFARAEEAILLLGVDSAAHRRRRLAEMLARAPEGSARDQIREKFLAEFGDEAPVWDIASPTHREDPTTLEAPAAVSLGVPERAAAGEAPGAWQEAEARIRARLSPDLADGFSACLARARQAAAIGEDDDWLYARAQAQVRAAVLAVGRSLAVQGAIDTAEDVFFLPLETIRTTASGAPPPATLRETIAEARARGQQALHNPPPLPSGHRNRPRPSHAAQGAAAGFGTGGRAIGPAFLWPGNRRPPKSAIVVATSLLPTELPLLDVAGLVTETGGPLGHVATQARERGLPAVVGAIGATRLFQAGELVLVDAGRGLVLRCSRRP